MHSHTTERRVKRQSSLELDPATGRVHESVQADQDRDTERGEGEQALTEAAELQNPQQAQEPEETADD